MFCGPSDDETLEKVLRQLGSPRKINPSEDIPELYAEVGIRGPGRPGGGGGPDLKRDMEAFGRLVEGGEDDSGRGGPEVDHPGRG